MWVGDHHVTPNLYYVTATGGDGTTVPLSFAVVQDQFDVENSANGVFNAVPVNADLAARYGGSGAFNLNAEVVQNVPLNHFSRSKIDASVAELKEEKSLVKDLLS